MKKLLSIIGLTALALLFIAAAPSVSTVLRTVLVNTNDQLVFPTNFWRSNFTAGSGITLSGTTNLTITAGGGSSTFQNATVTNSLNSSNATTFYLSISNHLNGNTASFNGLTNTNTAAFLGTTKIATAQATTITATQNIVADYLWTDQRLIATWNGRGLTGATDIAVNSIGVTGAVNAASMLVTNRYLSGTSNAAPGGTGGTNVVIDARAANFFVVTATTNLYFTNIANLTTGYTAVIHILQDATGGRSVTFDTNTWKVGTNAYSFVTNANAWQLMTIVSDPHGTNAAVANTTKLR